VLEVIDLERLKPSIKFIEKALKPYEADLLYVPYKNKSVKMEIVFEDDLIKTKDWLENDVSYLKIKEIKGNGLDLLTENDKNALEIYYPSINYAGLINLICTTYGIPSKYYTVEVRPDIDKNLEILMNNKKLATTKAITNGGF